MMKSAASLLMIVALAGRALAGPAPEPAPAQPLLRIEPIYYPAANATSAAGKERLRAERIVFGQELANNATWDPTAIQQAVAAMQEGAADTVEDNIARFGKALAALHEKFRAGWELYQAGKWTEATAAFAPLLKEKVMLIKARYQHNTMPPYSYTLTRFLQAECQARDGNLMDAVISYQVCADKLPGNLTFCASAQARAAQIYEATGRAHYALPFHKANAALFASQFTDLENLRLNTLISKMAANDPFRLALRTTGELEQRLAAADTGAETKALQDKLMEHLEYMLAEAEEEARQFLEHTEVIAKGALTGELREGAVPPELMLTNPTVAATGTDDWGKLRPREKQQLLQMFQEQYPQRYRDMIESYFKAVSEAETQPGRDGR
jgi:hypothetical protein